MGRKAEALCASGDGLITPPWHVAYTHPLPCGQLSLTGLPQMMEPMMEAMLHADGDLVRACQELPLCKLMSHILPQTVGYSALHVSQIGSISSWDRSKLADCLPVLHCLTDCLCCTAWLTDCLCCTA